jgi:hypothetical protein
MIKLPFIVFQEAKELDKSTLSEDCEHPSSSPIYWISKWVDYSDKYGIGKYSQNTISYTIYDI